VEAQWTARDRHLQRFVTEQPPYSILARGIEAEVLPTCAKYGMGVIPYSPLAGGWLSGRWRKDSNGPAPASPARQRLVERYDMSLRENQRKLEATEQLAEEAGRRERQGDADRDVHDEADAPGPPAGEHAAEHEHSPSVAPTPATAA
jgi:aryl-alcohol dehydrogenase-like predicted oxidoreductase